MYTRHTSINIPKNYSGNRFKTAPDNIPVKEHRPVYNEGIKTAHSPAYNEEMMKVPDISSEYIPPYFDNADLNEELDSQDESIENTGKNEDEKTCEDTSYNATCALSSFSLPFRDILSHIDKEELLLIGIILLLASEKENDNSLMITLLSLLLLYK